MCEVTGNVLILLSLSLRLFQLALTLFHCFITICPFISLSLSLSLSLPEVTLSGPSLLSISHSDTHYLVQSMYMPQVSSHSQYKGTGY